MRAAAHCERIDRTLASCSPIACSPLDFGSGNWRCGSTAFRLTCCQAPARSAHADRGLGVAVAIALVTLTTTFEGFLLAAAGGVGLAVLFNQSRLVEYSLYPYAVILQVTPIVAIAPLC